MTTPSPIPIKMPLLSEVEKENFEKAQLYRLFEVMNKPADEEFAKEAVQGYNAADNSTTVRNTELVISKEELMERLGMSGTSDGEAWTKK